ncbi:hypothetical protein Hanom_Chr08g00722191 [Helianthus anomalus]
MSTSSHLEEMAKESEKQIVEMVSIKWKESDFEHITKAFEFRTDWGDLFGGGLDCCRCASGHDYLVHRFFFGEGKFRLPITIFFLHRFWSIMASMYPS